MMCLPPVPLGKTDFTRDLYHLIGLGSAIGGKLITKVLPAQRPSHRPLGSAPSSGKARYRRQALPSAFGACSEAEGAHTLAAALRCPTLRDPEGRRSPGPAR